MAFTRISFQTGNPLSGHWHILRTGTFRMCQQYKSYTSMVLRCTLPLLAVFLVTHPLLAIRPDDPKVTAMLEKAVAFLEGNGQNDPNVARLGGRCLTAMAIYKFRKNPQHPVVQNAVAMCRAVAANPNQNFERDFNYSLGIAIIFLCELDPVTYKREIEILVDLMARRQRPDGAWSYFPDYPTGDTSQTQYGALSMWLARMRGVQVPFGSVAAYANWLIRIQDSNGMFPYQGTDPGHYNRVTQPNRVAQPDAAYRMMPAALGALYIAGDILGLTLADSGNQAPVFRKASEIDERGPNRSSVDVNLWRRAIRDGNSFYDRNFRIDVEGGMYSYQYYYLYSVERYFSLREKFENREDPEPRWYTAGVEFLSRHQAGDGSWSDNTGPGIATGFACLFLMRSTKKIILSEGALVGGRYLPEDLSKIRLEDGKVVGTQDATDFDTLMDLVKSGEAVDVRNLVAQIDHIQLRADRPVDRSRLEALKKVVSNGNYLARLAAVRSLANTRDLEQAPVLIYALSDPDWRVAREARDGLRLLTGRIAGFGMPDRPTRLQQRQEQLAWRDYIKSIRPDLEIPDEIILPADENAAP
ncbi:MAG: hypothetical protein KatS3mg110_0153 [Pirellulaceae bacterium]|nr:MAG: hypothetical protein KatS3mg110_0153 [Pirellulaceae bacterium]